MELENAYTCKHCQKPLDHGEIPKFSCPREIRHNKCICSRKKPIELEEQLVSMCFPFIGPEIQRSTNGPN